MNEVGIDISNQTSHVINPEILNNAALVVILCGHPVEYLYINYLHMKRIHWGFDNPSTAAGTDEGK